MNHKNEGGPGSVALDDKLLALRALLSGLKSAVVAFSGGVDSSFLLAAAADAPGLRVLALTADSPSLPASDRDLAIRFARDRNVELRFVKTKEMENPLYVANGPDRCYHCKHALFDELFAIAKNEGYRHVLYGANADDEGDYRPGHQAAEEFGVCAPLADLGFTKDEIRRALRKMGLEVAEKPAAACLSSRIPYGAPITRAVLDQVDRAEQALRDLGLNGPRVRVHGDVARIEVSPKDIAKAADGLRDRIVDGVRAAGFRYVTLDLVGYRTGSLNEALPAGTMRSKP